MLKALNEEVGQRLRALNSFSHLPSGIMPEYLKLSEEDLAQTLSLSERLVQSFFEEHLEPRMNKERIESFWEVKDLEENDFRGLTEHYYSTLFGKYFLTPFREIDKKFVIQVRDEGLKDMVSHFPKVSI
jgi:hypothetical protein